MGNDLHGTHVAPLAQRVGHLCQTVLPSLQKHHLSARLQALQQGGGVLHAGVDEDDAARRACGLGNVGHDLPPWGFQCFWPLALM